MNAYLGSATDGSSPRAWGTRKAVYRQPGRRRFIPTCVGNTVKVTAQPSICAVHPHVRGEHSLSFRRVSLYSGSSPRAWGTRGEIPPPQSGGRFIPTCVGNTSADCMAQGAVSVHPHVRGEHAGYLLIRSAINGSSPRAWGTPFLSASARSSSRFIPTCVGNTRAGRRRYGYSAVHPHVRGEHLTSWLSRRRPIGSSPRAWGTQSRARSWTARQRFIPTCVGNTGGDCGGCR